MRRVPEVIDCWYDSGAMPFAQWGYPNIAKGATAANSTQQFPADFISEAIDQTRGWFYSQLAISTLMFGKAREAEAARREGNPISAFQPSPLRPSPTPIPSATASSSA